MASGVSDIIASHLSPFVIVGALGGDIRRNERGHFTSCPTCGSDMHILTHDLVCENESCQDGVISGVEYVALSRFNGDLHTASKAFSTLPVGKSLPVGIPPKEIEQHYSRVRKIRHLFRQQDGVDRKRRYLHALAEGWMRKNKLDPEIMAKVSRVWTADDMDTYNKISKPSLPLRLGDGQFALAVPYYASYSEVGAVVFVVPGQKKPIVHTLDTYRYLWAGLSNVMPGAGGCMITQNFSKFFQCLAGGKHRHPGHPFLCMLFDGMCTRYKYLPEDPIYLFDPDKDISMVAPANLAKDTQKLEVADSRKPYVVEKRESWSRFILEEAARRALKEPIVDTLTQFIDSCLLTHAQERRLCKFLQGSGHSVVALGLERHFSTKLIIDDDKLKVHAGPGGYFSVVQKTGARTDISNFLAHPLYNVVFKDDGELLTRLQIVHEGTSFEVSVPLSVMDVPAQFEDGVREGWMKSGSTSDIPVLKDRGLFRKYLSRYLKDCASGLPCRAGIGHLGWNFRKTEFRGPGWKITSSGVENDEGVLHSAIPFLNRFKEVNFPSTVCDIPKLIANNLLAEISYLILGYLYRGRFDKKTWSYQTAMSVNDAEKVGLALSQLGILPPSSYELSTFNGHDASHNRGMPFLANTTTKRTLFGGLVVTPVPTQEDRLENISIEELSGWFACIMEKGVTYLLALTEEKNLPRRLDDKILLMQEGGALLQDITGAELDEVVSPYSTLESVLCGVDYETLGSWISLDLENGQLALKRSAFKAEGILPELWQLTGHVDVTDDAYLVGMTALAEPLTSYYQTERIPYGRLEPSGSGKS